MTRRKPPPDEDGVFDPDVNEDIRPLTGEAIAALLSGVRFEDLTCKVFSDVRD